MFEHLIETLGEPLVGIAGGLLVGVIFGIMAQRSRFCFRSAVIEVGRSGSGERFGLWLLALAVAMIAVQTAVALDLVTLEAVRPLSGRGSLSGALIGGLMFGAGMVLSRGCVSRLLVLSAGGNLRAIATTAIFVVVALATMRGPFSAARETLAAIQPIEGAHQLSLLSLAGGGPLAGIALGAVLLVASLVLGLRKGLSLANAAFGAVIGLVVAGGYLFTSGMNGASFDPQPVQGLSFIAPYANALAMALGQISARPDFGIAVIPGVALGAFVAALVARELRIEVFHSAGSFLRYATGAALMGFGGVVATGCSLGNGVSGLAVFSTTAAVALAGMWAGAALTDMLVDREQKALTPAPAFVAAE